MDAAVAKGQSKPLAPEQHLSLCSKVLDTNLVKTNARKAIS
jgi:hypothetical protein